MNLKTLQDWHPRAQDRYHEIDHEQYDRVNHCNTMREREIWDKVIQELFPDRPEWHGAIYVLYAGWHYYGGEWPK